MREVNLSGKKAIDIIVSTWVERHSELPKSAKEFNLVFPSAECDGVTISMTRAGFDDLECVNYLVNGVKAYSLYERKCVPIEAHVWGPPIAETRLHPLRTIFRAIHEGLVDAGFYCDGKVWNGLNPSWKGYHGQNFSYKTFSPNSQDVVAKRIERILLSA